ncbi:hypothetical protein IKG13_02235 [Candidatus Saccharibacteria bacterium]|nr:hypothetical protein [Candidatus Saccharibacteria bacterium]MBR3378202.1 hypothetical protein [Candidatus Saccharibacteria bacterium]
MPTPAADNIYQEFRSCPEGKIINPETGNCINEKSLASSVIKTCPEGQYLNVLTNRCKKMPTAKTQTACKAGYYRNPLTGRCKKQAAAKTAKTCPEGYELNPSTNRCRKKRQDASKFPVENITNETYDNPQIFIAAFALITLGILVLIYVIFQFRHEMSRFIKRATLIVCRRKKY